MLYYCKWSKQASGKRFLVVCVDVCIHTALLYPQKTQISFQKNSQRLQWDLFINFWASSVFKQIRYIRSICTECQCLLVFSHFILESGPEKRDHPPDRLLQDTVWIFIVSRGWLLHFTGHFTGIWYHSQDKWKFLQPWVYVVQFLTALLKVLMNESCWFLPQNYIKKIYAKIHVMNFQGNLSKILQVNQDNILQVYF